MLVIIASQLAERSIKMGEFEEINEDYINDLCERADYYGMESLTEEEQYLLLSRPLVD